MISEEVDLNGANFVGRFVLQVAQARSRKVRGV